MQPSQAVGGKKIMAIKHVLIGKAAVPGKAKGRALVTESPLTFMGGVDYENGTFDDHLYPELRGLSMAGQILIFPFGKGSTGDSVRLWRCVQNNVGPIGIINIVADPILVQGAILANIPMVYDLERGIFNIMKTGDMVSIDGNKVTIYD
jgi:predicted aconitase with swiveling domain